jgi:hypothetical protein
MEQVIGGLATPTFAPKNYSYSIKKRARPPAIALPL